MTQIKFYGDPVPGFTEEVLPGKLIVLEGTDGVGRSTQIALLQEWLEGRGFAVASTGLRRSDLASKGIDRAKQGHTLSEGVLFLLYVTDLADRLETQIIPALRAGMVVLTDRYIYSMIVRSQVRGSDPQWIRKTLGFALVPDAVFYLQADLNHLIPRVLAEQGGFDYWESGMDFLKGRDLFRNYVRYQTRLLAQFDAIAEEFGFRRIDANRSIREIFSELRREVSAIVTPMKRQASVEVKPKEPSA
ncbi:MAG: thymidylate kinase [Anaerolineae bacterium]